jgi:cell filamentation protein
VPGDPYTDPATGVLRNQLGLTTAPGLEAAEREITHSALILLWEAPVRPGYDLLHLREIHRRIFGDIYEWAGQIRTVAISKGSLFCLPRYIESAAAEIFGQLRKEDFLRNLAREEFLDRLTYYLGEVNAIHPFREGNGRAQRTFFEQLTSDAGYRLNWQHLDLDRNVEASVAIMRGDAALMRRMLDELVGGS